MDYNSFKTAYQQAYGMRSDELIAKVYKVYAKMTQAKQQEWDILLQTRRDQKIHETLNELCKDDTVLETTFNTGRKYNGTQVIDAELLYSLGGELIVFFYDRSRAINGIIELDDIDVEMLQDETLFPTQANKAKYLENFIMAKYDAGQYKNA